MAANSMPDRQERIDLVADAALFTAAAACLTLGFVPLALLIGPGLVWWLHGRRLDRPAIIGGVLGLIAGIAAFGALFGLLLLGGAFEPGGSAEFGLLLAVIVPLIAVFAAVVVAVDVASLRDIALGRRTHRRLDIARLAATAVLVVSTLAVILIQANNSSSEVFELGLFALGAAAIGAVAMAVATPLAKRLAARAKSNQI